MSPVVVPIESRLRYEPFYLNLVSIQFVDRVTGCVFFHELP